MSDCLVTGMPNVGKTCFVINFAEYMGLKKLKFHVRQLAGYTSISSYTPDEAMDKLVSYRSNFTRDVQSINLEIPAGKTIKRLEIIDSCGLSDGIHPDEEVRQAMARTIRLIRRSNLILHMIDITNLCTQESDDDVLMPIDRMILNYASQEKNYAILANKTDLLQAAENLELLKKNLTDKLIIPISALYQKGFKEVKKLVLSYV
jgi:predicted GTPase